MMLKSRCARVRTAMGALTLAALVAQPALAEPPAPPQRLEQRRIETAANPGLAREVGGINGGQARAMPQPLCQIHASGGGGDGGQVAVRAGQTVTLSWRCSFAASARLLPQGDAVPTTGEIQVTPARTTTYSLSATGGGGARAFPIQVAVRAPETAMAQRATMPLADGGRSDHFIIHHDPSQAQKSKWSADLPPSERPQSANGSVQQSASASQNSVHSPCNLWASLPGSRQYATIANIAYGQSATLTWQCPQGISNVAISHYGPVSSPTGGSVTVSPTAASTQYEITSSGASIAYPGWRTLAYVNVDQSGAPPTPAPVCSSFLWDTGGTDYRIPIGAEGAPRTLTWACTNFSQAIQVSGDDGRFRSEPPTGSMQVCPTQDYTYQLVAPYTTIPEMKVTSTSQSPILRSATITFHTNDDDKDHDTRVNVTLADALGGVLASTDINNDTRFPDNSDSAAYPVSVPYGTSLDRSEVNNARIVITINPVGNDTWKFNFKLDLKYSNGAHSFYGWRNVVLSESGTQQSWLIANISTGQTVPTPIVSSCH